MRPLAFLAAASLGLGVAVIVDQPAAFARCDKGGNPAGCPCRDKGTFKDKVDHSKCPNDQFCAQKVPETGDKHVYVCRPRKPNGWGCTGDNECKSQYCKGGMGVLREGECRSR